MTDGKKQDIGETVAIFYDHQIGRTVYHGAKDKIKKEIDDLVEIYKWAESELGFLLIDYALHHFKYNEISEDILNRTINEKGFFPKL